MKKILALLLALVMVLSLGACAPKEEGELADDLSYYTEAGLTAEGFKGTSYTEALGTQQATIAVGHIATMLVPITNGVDLTFVGGAHIGCKTLYVLADSAYKTTADPKGTKVSFPTASALPTTTSPACCWIAAGTAATST